MASITNIDLAKAVAAGLGPEEIADRVGVTVSAISQAISQPEVQHLVALETQKSDAIKFDNRYDDLESKILTVMERRVPHEAQSMKMRELTHMLNTVNGIKRRSGLGSNSGQPAQVVNLTMPIQIAAKIVLTQQSEIVEIDGRPMATADPLQISRLVEVQNAAQPKQIADLL